jgi:hypothetical protein
VKHIHTTFSAMATTTWREHGMKVKSVKVYEGVELWRHSFLTSAVDGGEWSVARADRLILGERASSTPCIGGWVDPRASLDGQFSKKKNVL